MRNNSNLKNRKHSNYRINDILLQLEIMLASQPVINFQVNTMFDDRLNQSGTCMRIDIKTLVLCFN